MSPKKQNARILLLWYSKIFNQIKQCPLKRMIPRSFDLVRKCWFYNHFLKHNHLQKKIICARGIAVHKFSLCFVCTDQWVSGQQSMEVKKNIIPDWNVMKRKKILTMIMFREITIESKLLNQFQWSVGALWCSGSCSQLVIRGSWVRIPLSAYALRQGILSTLVSLDPGVVNGYPAGIYSL